MSKFLPLTTTDERMLLTNVQNAAVAKVLSDYAEYSGNLDNLGEAEKKLEPLFDLLQKRFFSGLDASLSLVKESFNDSRYNPKRISYHNRTMETYKQSLDKVFPQAARIWVLDGLIFQNQVAGVKKLTGFNDQEGLVVDVLNSAASLSLGAENPWLVKMDYMEDLLGIRDNICAAYHPGIRQGYALQKLAELYPNKQVKKLSVHTESSGTIVNSVAVESVVAFAEKRSKSDSNKKVLAINGTWAGGYGSAREGTGFGVDAHQLKRAGQSVWMDRCLPPPTTEHRQKFLDLIKEKIAQQKVAGIYLEADVVGDLGLVVFDPELLRQVKQLMLINDLPIIADCVQQLGRTGSYWGNNVDTILADYPLLVVTAAKSASNGQPFGFTIMPKEVAGAAYPLTQITTNQMNGPLFRSLVVAEILQNEEMQNWFKSKSEDMEEIASKYHFDLGNTGLRGKFLNRGICLENNDQVKLAQIALLIEDGILVGATPDSIRYQPMLLEYSETNRLLAETILRRVNCVKIGDVSPVVVEIHNRMEKVCSGLARKNC